MIIGDSRKSTFFENIARFACVFILFVVPLQHTFLKNRTSDCLYLPILTENNQTKHMLITLIAGTRPNFMKIAPLIKAIQADESRRTQGPLYHPPRKDAPRQNRLCLVETGLQQRTRSTRWDCRRFSSPHHNKLCRGPHKNHLVLISLIVERFFHRKLSPIREGNQNKPTERSILAAF